MRPPLPFSLKIVCSYTELKDCIQRLGYGKSYGV